MTISDGALQWGSPSEPAGRSGGFLPPDTRYATRGGLNIAYQVFGSGPRDLVLVDTGQHPVDLLWEEPLLAGFLERLAGFSRVICFDLRGWGASDPLNDLPVLETWAEDIAIVLDEVGSSRAALVGMAEAGSIAALFAATSPQRTSALVLVNAFARFFRAPDYPFGIPEALEAQRTAAFARTWGTGENLDFLGPSMRHDRQLRQWLGRAERLAASRATATKLWRATLHRDIRSVLPAIQVPTLVLHRAKNTYARVAHGRYLAEHIDKARFVELPGRDHLYYVGGGDSLADEITEFVTGVRPEVGPERTLATIMFTDIVESTRHAANVGDRRWQETLERFERMAGYQIDRFRGERVKATGDGVLATFDGPARALRCATAVRDEARDLGIEIRVGLHTGEVEHRGGDIGGIAVHIGQRVLSAANPGEVLVSRTVKDLAAGSGFRFIERGSHVLRGVPERWDLYTAEN
jgi:class 3 adenylate cyclase